MSTYRVGQKVAAIITRCKCIGGGTSEVHANVVGIVNAPNGTWYQLDTPNGISTVSEQNIIKVIEG